MSPKRTDSAEEILRDKTGDIARLRQMGVTDFAIVTYVVRVQNGEPKEKALRELLLGRSINSEQERFVRTVLDRIPIT